MNDRATARRPTGFQWAIGILDRSPEQLAEALGIQFTRESDDLDTFVEARLSDSQIGDLVLLRHLGSPDPGLEVRVDTSIARDEALNAVWRETGLDIRAFCWVTPYRSFSEALGGAGWRLEGGALIPPEISISGGQPSLSSAAEAVPPGASYTTLDRWVWHVMVSSLRPGREARQLARSILASAPTFAGQNTDLLRLLSAHTTMSWRMQETRPVRQIKKPRNAASRVKRIRPAGAVSRRPRKRPVYVVDIADIVERIAVGATLRERRPHPTR